jgi:SAM-dependent methyltransferase
VTAWQWLRDRLRSAPPRWLNIHAGLDESTETLARMYPGSAHAVLDIYDGREMTEASIARARRIHTDRHPALPAGLGALPFPEATQDAVFLLFAAHEVRRHERRVTLLREAGRVLATEGRIVLVEHLRDWKNFVAFGPGFLHFYSRREWLHAAAEAKLAVEQESCVTPFVRCLVLVRCKML